MLLSEAMVVRAYGEPCAVTLLAMVVATLTVSLACSVKVKMMMASRLSRSDAVAALRDHVARGE